MELENPFGGGVALALSLNALEELGVNAQGQPGSPYVSSLELILIGKSELIQVGFDERKPRGSQLHWCSDCWLVFQPI